MKVLHRDYEWGPEFHAGFCAGPGYFHDGCCVVRSIARVPDFYAANNAGTCFCVRDQELRAAFNAGAGTPCRIPSSQPGSNASSRISVGIRMYLRHSMPEFHAGSRCLTRDRNFHAGFNVGSCFLVRGQGFRADFTAGSGTPPGTRSPNIDSMRDHVSRSGFGGTFGIQCGIRELARAFS